MFSFPKPKTRNNSVYEDKLIHMLCQRDLLNELPQRISNYNSLLGQQQKLT